MPFALSIVQGRKGTFLLSDPRPRTTINRTDVDAREDTWCADSFPNPLLTEGRPHPLKPGLILERAEFDEVAPAFPAIPGREGVAGEWRATCNWRGNAQSNAKQGATKIINRGSRRTLENGFDERTVRSISWYAEPFAITGVASTDVITTTQPHGFVDGRPIILPSLTGGAGLTAASYTSNGTVYYTKNGGPFSFQVSTTVGGSAVNFTTDITAGYVVAAEYALGSPHPEFPYMFLCELGKVDDYTDWKTVDATYRGLEWVKPYRREINGAVTTSNSKFDGYTLLTGNIYQSYPPTDSGSDATLSGTNILVEYDASTVSLTDHLIWVGTPPTDKIGTFWTPPDPPDVTYFSLAGVKTKYFFPFTWKCVGCPVQPIPGTNLSIISPTFIFQVLSIPVPA